MDTAVWFSGGSTVTITGGQTADTDKLYECSLGGINCQQVVGSLTFTPTGNWELMGTGQRRISILQRSDRRPAVELRVCARLQRAGTGYVDSRGGWSGILAGGPTLES